MKAGDAKSPPHGFVRIISQLVKGTRNWARAIVPIVPLKRPALSVWKACSVQLGHLFLVGQL